MLIRYTRADPSGNITALVETPLPAELRAAAAAAVFAADGSVEQLGFISETGPGELRLDMAGGEFCGNASLSAAAWLLRRRKADAARLSIAVSGAEAPVAVDIRRVAENEYEGLVEMPLPLETGSHGGFPLVRFPGISHLILPADVAREEAEAMIRPLCRSLGAEALGIMLYDAAEMRLEPLVYVPGADSLFWESSCASGSCAAAAWTAAEQGKSLSLQLRQKGGVIAVEALYKGGLRSLRMGGRVKLGETLSLNF